MFLFRWFGSGFLRRDRRAITWDRVTRKRRVRINEVRHFYVVAGTVMYILQRYKNRSGLCPTFWPRFAALAMRNGSQPEPEQLLNLVETYFIGGVEKNDWKSDRESAKQSSNPLRVIYAGHLLRVQLVYLFIISFIISVLLYSHLYCWRWRSRILDSHFSSLAVLF